MTSTSFSPSYVPNSYDFLEADACVIPGDSGGAVFRQNTAYGLVSGYFKGTTCRDVNGNLTNNSNAGTMVFSSVQFDLNALSQGLLTNVNLPPNAGFSSSCSVLLNCSFDGSYSTDYDGSVVSWSWQFGDGQSAQGEYVSHTYTLPGSKTVTLTVCDDDGACGSSSSIITVT